MARYVSPVNPAIFAHLTFVLMAIGLFFTAWFFVYEVTSTKFTRDPKKELLIKFVASVFMGLGSHFLILWVGIYIWSCHFLCNKIFKCDKCHFINCFTCSPCWNRHHHGQTIHPIKKFISMNSLCCNIGIIIFDLHGYGGC